VQAVWQSRPLPSVPPTSVQRSGVAAISHFGTMQSEMLLHLRVVPVHVPSRLPSAGFESPAQSRCFGTQHVTVSAGLPQAERDAVRRIWAAQDRGTGPHDRLPFASGVQALSSRNLLVMQRTWSAWTPGPSQGHAASISA
jgi:hypothetical protein